MKGEGGKSYIFKAKKSRSWVARKEKKNASSFFRSRFAKMKEKHRVKSDNALLKLFAHWKVAPRAYNIIEIFLVYLIYGYSPMW